MLKKRSRPKYKAVKRRKAVDIERLFICGDPSCLKSYGSYPALYTHIKTKHDNIEPKGTIKPSSQGLKDAIRRHPFKVKRLYILKKRLEEAEYNPFCFKLISKF
jgi:hypothetical protein